MFPAWFYPEVFLTLCAFKSLSLSLSLSLSNASPILAGRQMPLLPHHPHPPVLPSILASLSIHHALYDRSPTSSSSGSPLPLWHSVKRWPAEAPAPARPLLGLLSSLSWPDSTAPPPSFHQPPPSFSNLDASCGRFRGQNCLGTPLSGRVYTGAPAQFCRELYVRPGSRGTSLTLLREAKSVSVVP